MREEILLFLESSWNIYVPVEDGAACGLDDHHILLRNAINKNDELGNCGLELQTKVKLWFAKISQSQRRPLLGP